MQELKSSGELQEHMLWTYYGLRVGLAAIGIALPILVLLAGGALHDVWLRNSTGPARCCSSSALRTSAWPALEIRSTSCPPRNGADTGDCTHRPAWS